VTAPITIKNTKRPENNTVYFQKYHLNSIDLQINF